MKEALTTIIVFLMMFIVVLFMHSCEADAWTIENTFGGLTYHIWNQDNIAERYSNKISDNGQLIFTGLIGIGSSDGRDNFNMFVGQNSVGDIMFGGTYAYLFETGILKYGPIAGFYLQNDDNFLKRGIVPYSIGYGIVPIIGMEVSVKILTFDHRFVRLNTLISPAIINETISLGMEL